jgi:hypothetical protein
LQSIDKGVWKVSDKDGVPQELIPQLERQMGGQVTMRDFWTNLWDTQQEFPERFKLQTSPDVTADDLKAAAAAAGKRLFIHAQVDPVEITTNEKGGQSISMNIGNSDNGALEGKVPLSLDEMISGDRFFICQITS